MLNISLKQFKINHKKKINQILYLSLDSDGSKEIINLINNFFTEKNAFVFESVEKGFIKGTPEYQKCIYDKDEQVTAERKSLEKKLAKMSQMERIEYQCENVFNFRKNSSK